MRAAPALALLVVLLLAAPAAMADHPGSNKGLMRFATPLDPLGLNAVVHRLPDVDLKLAEWNTAYPDLVERKTIGTTSSGLPLYSVRVTDESVAYDAAPLSTGQKLRVYLDGGHHGNEFLGVELVMYYIDELLDKASNGDEPTLKFLRESEVYAVPMLNVDGNTLDTRKNSRQVDVNRNYDFHWGEEGASDSITDFTYHGPSAESEAEVKANADYGRELMPQMWITMHTGIAEFYWPWGWTHDPSPDDAFFTSLEKPFEDATNGRVDAMQGAELYIVSGATDDWAYGVLGTPGFTFEVHEDQFIPVYGEAIPDLIKDQLAGLDFMVKNVRHMGAWVEATRTATGWTLTNEGWGAAPHINVTSGGNTWTLAELGRGESIDIQAGDDLVISYPTLFIDTAQTRTHDFSGVSMQSGAAPETAIPAPGLALVVALGAAVAVAMRRRAA